MDVPQDVGLSWQKVGSACLQKLRGKKTPVQVVILHVPGMKPLLSRAQLFGPTLQSSRAENLDQADLITCDRATRHECSPQLLVSPLLQMQS